MSAQKVSGVHTAKDGNTAYIALSRRGMHRRTKTKLQRLVAITATVAVISLAIADTAGAEEAAPPTYYTLTLENDLFAGKDNGYTNGFAFSWARGGFDTFENQAPGWIRWLSSGLYISTMPDKRRAVSYTLAQTMYTPVNLARRDLIEDEAPYAGALLWSGRLHAFDTQVADSLSLTLGIVGPSSGAEQSQTLVHDFLSGDKPQGWHNQLRDEPVFQIGIQRLARLAETSLDNGAGLELTGIGIGDVGNLKSQTIAGIGVRYGRDLDRTFPATTALPGREVNPLAGAMPRSWNMFFNILGGYIFNDITVDGNTFRDSHSVPLRHWQAMIVGGVGYSFGRFAIQFSAVAATPRYDGEPDSTRFGTVNLTYRH